MIKINYNPDVLSCIANLSNDEVFTPPNVVNEMLDILPQELFENKNTTFLDPVTKSGVFLREIAERLIVGLEKEIPDLQERLNHIYTRQLFGIAITELTSLLARRSTYCSKVANSRYSVCTEFEDEIGNIIYDRTEHTWANGKCIFCGASEEVYSRSEDLETHAYQFIHNNNPSEIFNMKFDVIIGNPPYQLSDGGSGTGISAKPLYHEFVMQAKRLNPRYLSMIIPSRWFAGGKGLNEFRADMLNDQRLSKIVDFISSKDCFPGVNIAGGVCYFLWESSYSGECVIVNRHGKKSNEMIRRLNEFDVFIRDNHAISIIRKILDNGCDVLSNHVFTRNPFGFVSSARGMASDFPGSIKLISSGGIGYVTKNEVLKNHNEIDKYKVTIGKVVPSNGEVDVTPDVGYKVTTKSRILEPNEIHTESYMLLSSFEDKQMANNFSEYISQKFPRFLLKQTLSSMNISVGSFMFVPFLDFSIKWTDEKLYKYFNLNNDEIELIESIIRPMDD